MNAIDFDVIHLAKLARMDLTDEECKRFSRELEQILAYVDQLQKVNVGNVEETAQVTGLLNVLRADEFIERDLEVLRQARQDLLRAAPQTENGLVKVPVILGGE